MAWECLFSEFRIIISSEPLNFEHLNFEISMLGKSDRSSVYSEAIRSVLTSVSINDVQINLQYNKLLTTNKACLKRIWLQIVWFDVLQWFVLVGSDWHDVSVLIYRKLIKPTTYLMVKYTTVFISECILFHMIEYNNIDFFLNIWIFATQSYLVWS